MIGIEKQTAKYNAQAQKINTKIEHVKLIGTTEQLYLLVPALQRAGAAAKDIAKIAATYVCLTAVLKCSEEVDDGK